MLHKNLAIISFFCLPVLGCAQTTSDKPDWSNLYNCEGCEAIYEGMASGWSIKIASDDEPGDRLRINGVVFQSDGKTPAPNVVLYFHHTNKKGIYPVRGNEKGWGKRHGYLRGWLKTNERGEYEIETIRPAQYPSRMDAAHIHITIKEPKRKEYWIDDIVFTDDSLVNDEYRKERLNRGGSGIVTLRRNQGTWTGTRNITLAPPDLK